MNKIIRGVVYGLFGAGLFIATSMVFIAFSPKQINDILSHPKGWSILTEK